MKQLEVRGVSKSFDGKEVLQDISISLNEGELVCLLGISGGGKTTLFKGFFFALPGLLLCHTAGTVWVSFVTNVPLWTAALSASFPYLIKDLPLVFAALWCTSCVKKHLSLFRE